MAPAPSPSDPSPAVVGGGVASWRLILRAISPMAVTTALRVIGLSTLRKLGFEKTDWNCTSSSSIFDASTRSKYAAQSWNGAEVSTLSA